MTPTTRSIWLMVVAMAGFASADLMIKFAGARVPAGQIIVTIAGGSTVLFALLALRRREALISADLLARPVLLRNIAEALAVVMFVTGLTLTPLATFSAIVQITPILVTLGAIVFLSQRVGWRRWGAIGIGLAGVLLIIRPGAGGLSAGALLALGAASAMAMRDLSTRAVPGHIGSAQLAVWGNVIMVLAGGVLMAATEGPVALTLPDVAALGAAIVFASVAYFAITAAMRAGDIAAVVPYRYTRLVFALILSMLFLGERPDALTLLGAAIVVGAGIYALVRESRLHARR